MANGLPSLPSSVTIRTAALGAVQGRLWQILKALPVWGVFDASGAPVALSDAVEGFEYHNESPVSTAPVQAGSFTSYNKVDTPYNVAVRLVKGGSEKDRSDFLKALEAARASLTLYNVVTPERTYTNANIVSLDYRRTAEDGYAQIRADIQIQEVREVTAAYTTTAGKVQNAQNPASKSPENQGKVQQQLPSSAIRKLATEALSRLGN